MFPDRWPGAGLLLLRFAVGAVLITQGIAYLGDKHEPGLVVLAMMLVMSLLGLLLLIGLLTRFVAIAALLATLGSISSLLPITRVGPLVTPTAAALAAVIAVAVTCLGPGALSIDARLFGRREIIIPTNLSKR
jgi:uncharacterized membrane protein YphA (DoxX/SURF4 family)